MKQAVLLQRVHNRETTVSNGEEAIELATREGARYLGDWCFSWGGCSRFVSG